MRTLLGGALGLALLAAPAFAQDTTVAVGPLVSFVLPIILTIVGGVISIAVAVLVPIMVKKFGLQNEANIRDAIQTSLTNTAAGAINKLGARAMDLTVDVRNPAVADLVQRAVNGAKDSFGEAGLTQEEIARRVLEKITEQLTAAGIVSATGDSGSIIPTSKP
jgi:hypothetical protein